MELMKRSCSVCKSKNFIEAYKQPIGSIVGVGDIGYIQHIVICKECGFCFASPILPPEIISGFYATLSNYENPQHGGYNPPEEKNKFHRAFELISKRFPPEFKGRVLDIGCSVAYGLSLFKEKGWAALGLDPSSQCAELSNKFYGVRVITSAFSMDILKSERPFDLIILSHVLEHLVSPQEMIADILELLSENGLLYIEVPNLLRPFVPMGYFSFEHLNYFTPVSLASIMGANGFSVDFLATFDNSAEVAPFYPVIASTWKKATRSPDPLMNDYDAAFSTVKNYVETSSHAVERLQAKIDLILSKIKPGRLAVWGAGIHTSQLLSLTTLAKADLAFIFDNDPKKHGKFINGIEVVPFMGSPEQIKSHIDAIVISSKASENEIYDQISVVSQR